MRAYLPVGWAALAELHRTGSIPGPVRGCAVDPAWRAGDPGVDEEQWEYEAQSQAAESLPGGVGVVLAVDVSAEASAIQDGWLEVPDPIRRTDVAAVLTADLAWFGVQEIPALMP